MKTKIHFPIKTFIYIYIYMYKYFFIYIYIYTWTGGFSIAMFDCQRVTACSCENHGGAVPEKVAYVFVERPAAGSSRSKPDLLWSTVSTQDPGVPKFRWQRKKVLIPIKSGIWPSWFKQLQYFYWKRWKAWLGWQRKNGTLTNEDVHVNVRACDSSNRLRCGCGCATHRIVAWFWGANHHL